METILLSLLVAVIILFIILCVVAHFDSKNLIEIVKSNNHFRKELSDSAAVYRNLKAGLNNEYSKGSEILSKEVAKYKDLNNSLEYEYNRIRGSIVQKKKAKKP